MVVSRIAAAMVSFRKGFQEEYALCADPIKDAEHIPLRLNSHERKIQRLMRGVILASRYTEKVDTAVALRKNRNAIILKEIVNTLTGLIVGLDMRKAAELLKEHDFAPYEREICIAVEACRRYKIMNPDLLRTDYVKFLYMIQDAVQNEMVREAIGFSVVTDLVTVAKYSRQLGVAEMLNDTRMPLCITPVPLLKSRTTLNKCLRCKDVTVNALVKDYASRQRLPNDNVEIIVRSLNDANCFSNDNVESTEKLLELLKKYFSPTSSNEMSNLAIEDGSDGSRLTHNHACQYSFVLQSLTLWKNICRKIYALWTISENDMLDPNEKYELRETGQGLQRVQKAPNLYRAVHKILDETKKELGEWVGSERIHIGDDQVPNAFYFIDKYGQVSRIIIPILRTLSGIEARSSQDTYYLEYLQRVWGGVEGAKYAILRDFFQHGFDGSGGDNMNDAGSCVDGRLTSAWNWCNNIRSKPFYPLFILSGFNSFDGDMTL